MSATSPAGFEQSNLSKGITTRTVLLAILLVNYMGQRRMFSNRIGNSAKFLQMPSESQLLYFHMILRADDDGVVESYPLMKLLGMASDNFKVLIAKGFIQVLNEDQVIVINDWLEHNTIRADRKTDSIYKHLLPETIKTIEAKPRSDVEDNSKRLAGQSTDGISKVKLSKAKTRQVNKTAEINSAGKEVNQFIELFKELNPTYSYLFARKDMRAASVRLLKIKSLEEWQKTVEFVVKFRANKFCPQITTPAQMEQKYSALALFANSLKEDIKSKNEKYKVAFS